MQQGDTNTNSAPGSFKRSWKRIVARLSLFGILIAFAVLMQRQLGPEMGPGQSYNGKTVSDWINSIQIADASDAAVTNLAGIGKKAVPLLIKAVEWKPTLRDKLGRFLWLRGYWAWVNRVGLNDPEQVRQKYIAKRGAMRALDIMGSSGKEALPTLRRISRDDKDWGNRAWALSAIIGIGPERRDAGLFIEALKDEWFIVRIQGARGLGKIATPAAESIAALKNSLQDPEEGVRKSACQALQKIDARSLTDLRPAPAK